MKKQMQYRQEAAKVIEIEQAAIGHLHAVLDEKFDRACDLLLQCEGRIIVIGLGKSGHVGHKLAATMASTGSPAFFVHAAEAAHGDLGMLTQKDVILALSNSGNTEEVIALLPPIKVLGIPVISITNNPESKLAREADINLNINVKEEACPLGLAPTASTTATLVLGDAIAIALLVARGFKEKDFAFSHPSGSLGKRLSLKVKSLMAEGEAIPQVTPNTTLNHVIIEITKKRLGMCVITNEGGTLLGIYTDGDIRRTLEKKIDTYTTPVSDVMCKTPKIIHENTQAIDALNIMREFKITSLVVLNEKDQVSGVIQVHHLLQAGLE